MSERRKRRGKRRVVEHGLLMSGGGMHVRNDDPQVDRIYPLPLWVEHHQRFGGKVYRRTVIVIEDWREVPVSATAAAKRRERSEPS